MRIKSQNPQKIIVWYGFWNRSVFNPYFFDNDAGQVITVNGTDYKSMILNFFWPEVDDLDKRNDQRKVVKVALVLSTYIYICICMHTFIEYLKKCIHFAYK